MAFEIDLVLCAVTYVTALGAGVVAVWVGLDLAGYHAPSYALLETLWLPFGLLSLVVFLAYFVGFASSHGQTPGKTMMRIRIVSVTGEKATCAMIVARTLGYLLSGACFGLGFLMALVTKRRRSLHDVLANTRVVAT